jgi:hypothetical protein
MLRLLIALALVIVSVQCASACTPTAGAQPACHHHKRAAACAHELVPATIVPSAVTDLSFVSEPADPQWAESTFVSFAASTAQDPSPPGASVPRLSVLRI